MFNIDQHLEQMRIKEFNPSKTLIQRTKEECEKSCNSIRKARENKKKIRKISLIALPTAAVLLIGMFLGATLFGSKSVGGETAVAFYTVDINPSILVNVNSEEIVTSLDSQNDDANTLISRLNCVGLPITDAIRQIITVAEKEGFLEDGEKYVLVGRFGVDGQQTEVLLKDLQSQLESELGDMINLLIVSGTIEDKENADDLNVSAGLLKLSEMADGVQITPDDKIEDVIDVVYDAPELSVAELDDGVKLSWSELDFEAMGYDGEVKYKIVAADTKAEVTSPSATVLKTKTIKANTKQPLSYTVYASPDGIDFGESKYYGLIAVYADNISISSNIVYATMPEEESEPTSSPTPKQSTEPTPTPKQSTEPAPSGKVSGRVSGEYIKLSWQEETSSDFQGYKIVASKTNPNPKYPEDGYLKYITDAGTTSKSLYEGYKGLKANTHYYFSVTYMYKDGRTVAGNAVYLKVPEKSDEPDPTPTPAATPKPPSGDYASASISGSVSDTTVNLSWSQINHDLFSGYKVVASKTNPNPKYPDDGHLKYIQDAGTTSYSKSVSGFEAGATYYFSITVMYSDGTKKAGNAVALVIPAGGSEPEGDPISTNISGSLSGTTVSLNWDQINHSGLDGYKVMYSFKDSTPVYGESKCYYKWIANAAQTSHSWDITILNDYVSGETCYFSITALYDGHSIKKPGNVISFTAP